MLILIIILLTSYYLIILSKLLKLRCYQPLLPTTNSTTSRHISNCCISFILLKAGDIDISCYHVVCYYYCMWAIRHAQEHVVSVLSCVVELSFFFLSYVHNTNNIQSTNQRSRKCWLNLNDYILLKHKLYCYS